MYSPAVGRNLVITILGLLAGAPSNFNRIKLHEQLVSGTFGGTVAAHLFHS